MKIFVIGASGRTGKLFTQLAVAGGHQVTALVRDKRQADVPGVSYTEGLPTDEQLLGRLLQGVDAVVVALGISRSSENPFARVVSPLTLISDTVKALLPAMKKNGISRLITISASGVGDSWDDMPLPAKLLIRYSNIMKAYEDHDRQEKLIRLSATDWTIVRPVMLNNKEDEAYSATNGAPLGGNISRKAVARFVLDTLESGSYKESCVTLSR